MVAHITTIAIMPELTEKYNPPKTTKDEQTFNVLGKVVASHLDRNPFLKVAEYDSGQSLHQLDTIFLEATPMDINATLELAEKFYPGFYETMVEPFLDRPELSREYVEKILQGKNIGLFTSHESLLDVVLTSLAFNIATSKQESVEFADLIRETELVVSRTILGLDVTNGDITVPAAEMVRCLGNLHFAFPDSNRIRKTDIDSKVISSNNLRMTRKLIERLRRAKSGGLTAIALPGTSDHPLFDLNGNLSQVVIQTVKEPTKKLAHKFDYALPVAVVMSGDKQCCIPGEITELPNIRDDNYDEFYVHEMMSRVAGTRQWATGVNTCYKLFDSRD